MIFLFRKTKNSIEEKDITDNKDAEDHGVGCHWK